MFYNHDDDETSWLFQWLSTCLLGKEWCSSLHQRSTENGIWEWADQQCANIWKQQHSYSSGTNNFSLGKVLLFESRYVKLIQVTGVNSHIRCSGITSTFFMIFFHGFWWEKGQKGLVGSGWFIKILFATQPQCFTFSHLMHQNPFKNMVSFWKNWNNWRVLDYILYILISLY